MTNHLEALLGWTMFFAPFALIATTIVRRQRQAKTSHDVAQLNANGLPMMGGVDVNGNPLGAVDTHLVNVNGLPMIGGVDAFGNSFGTYGHTH